MFKPKTRVHSSSIFFECVFSRVFLVAFPRNLHEFELIYSQRALLLLKPMCKVTSCAHCFRSHLYQPLEIKAKYGTLLASKLGLLFAPLSQDTLALHSVAFTNNASCMTLIICIYISFSLFMSMSRVRAKGTRT